MQNKKVLTVIAESMLIKVMKIEGQVEKWQAAGIISDEQAAKIVAFETGNRQPYALYGFLGLGATAIIIGIISLIAFNWDDISDTFKLVADLVLLIGLAFGILGAVRSKRDWLVQLHVALFLGMVLASFGLISQIFHLSGTTYQLLLTWLLICAPLALLLPGRLTMHWLLATAAVTLHSYITSLSWESYIVMFSVLPLSFTIIALVTGRTRHWLPLSKAATVWAAVFFVAGSIYAQFQKEFSPDSFLSDVHSSFLMLGTASVIALAFAWTKLTRRQSVWLSVAIILYGVFLTPKVLSVATPFWLAFLFIVVYLGFGLFALSVDHRRLFEFCLIAIGIRFLVIYFEIFGSLAATGVGLIAAGLVIIAAVWGYTKLRDRILERLSTWI